MTSRSVISRKNSVPSAQRFAYIAELGDAYCVSAHVVQRSLSHTYKTLNQKKKLPHDQCISLLIALKDMSKPLLTLCSAFEKLAMLPEALVPFHLDVFMALHDTQSQAKQVEAHIKRYYQYSISSELQYALELTPSILQLLMLFRAQLSKVDLLLKKTLGRRDVQSQDSPSVAFNRGDGRGQTPVLPVAVVSDPHPHERTDIVHQEALEKVASAALLNYKSALNQRLEQLSQVEMQKATFADPRNISLDLLEQEERIQEEIKRLKSEIGILEQIGKYEVS
jgi:hypothetical protein